MPTRADIDPSQASAQMEEMQQEMRDLEREVDEAQLQVDELEQKGQNLPEGTDPAVTEGLLRLHEETERRLSSAQQDFNSGYDRLGEVQYFWFEEDIAEENS